jgi:hypothetical protein
MPSGGMNAKRDECPENCSVCSWVHVHYYDFILSIVLCILYIWFWNSVLEIKFSFVSFYCAPWASHKSLSRLPSSRKVLCRQKTEWYLYTNHYWHFVYTPYLHRYKHTPQSDHCYVRISYFAYAYISVTKWWIRYRYIVRGLKTRIFTFSLLSLFGGLALVLLSFSAFYILFDLTYMLTICSGVSTIS